MCRCMFFSRQTGIVLLARQFLKFAKKKKVETMINLSKLCNVMYAPNGST